MADSHAFTAVIEASSGGGAYIRVPFDVEAAFGKKRVKVLATFNGVPYQGSLVRMGTVEHILIVRKDIRAEIAKQPGDEVEVTIREDRTLRTVTVPDDFAEALASVPEARAFFDGLAYTYRKEYVQWIAQAKREETRRRRIGRAVALLAAQRKER